MFRRALDLAGPGAGRTAVDLGCGAGRETRALLDAGWQVLAIDSEPGTQARLGRHPALTVWTRSFEDLPDLPAADLVYAGYALPFQTRASFDRLWSVLRSATLPTGRLAVNIFGERDSWAGDPEMTFLRADEVRALTEGLEIEHWQEEDGPGMAFSGPKHWHVFEVIARS